MRVISMGANHLTVGVSLWLWFGWLTISLVSACILLYVDLRSYNIWCVRCIITIPRSQYVATYDTDAFDGDYASVDLGDAGNSNSSTGDTDIDLYSSIAIDEGNYRIDNHLNP